MAIFGSASVSGDINNPDETGGLIGLINSLRNGDAVESRQAVNIIEVISEGEIEGFPSAAGLTKGTDAYNRAALKDIFLGKTPIVRASANPNNILDSDFNFQKIRF